MIGTGKKKGSGAMPRKMMEGRLFIGRKVLNIKQLY